MLLLLGIVAVFQQRRPEHPDAEARKRGPRADSCHLRAQHLVLGGAQATAAVLLRPIGYGPALVAHALEPDALRLGREFCVASAPEHVGIGRCRLAHLRRAIGFQPSTRFAAECFEIGGLSLAGPGVGHWSFPSI